MSIQTAVTIRKPVVHDGTAVWELVRRAGTLDLNSTYLYLLLCDRFRDTCAVAEQDGAVVGFISAFIPREQPDTLFIWQIAVDSKLRGQGIGSALLREVAERQDYRNRIRWVEATVGPSNDASNRLFQRFAADAGVSLRKSVEGSYEAALFPAGSAHEDECLLRIGPLKLGEATN